VTLTNFAYDPILDLAPWVGQRRSTFRFDLTNGVTGENLGEITPIRGASLTHDTSRTIKRQLHIALGKIDSAAINPITDRIDVTMVLANGDEWPLGRYMFTDESHTVFTSGKLSDVVLNDEMFLVDQVITSGVATTNYTVIEVIKQVLDNLPVTYTVEPSPFFSTQSWGIGVNRGQVIEALAVVGDYFSPWFGNDKKMHFIRSFDPATRVPDFDLDAGNQVIRAGIVESANVLTAPNRFVVMSNSSLNPGKAAVGIADVPPTAPHSIANRGFVIANVQTLQLVDGTQASAVASNLANRQTIFETTTLTTAPDPRYDSYNVVKWRDELWLDLGWSMTLAEGSSMRHSLRKSYTS
jgi:hypothetical protein